LFKYGSAQGDSKMQKDNEYATKRINIPSGIPWKQQLIRNIWLSINGIISFDFEYASFSPQRLPSYAQPKLLAVYWTDLDVLSWDSGEVYYQLYTKNGGSNKNSDIFARANNEVGSYAGLADYDCSIIIVVTWDDIAPYPVELSEKERVTFQAIIISDGASTYVIYIYGNGAMNFDPVMRRAVQVGWGSTNFDTMIQNYYKFDMVIGNTGEVGKWFYKIGEKENFQMKCQNWYLNNVGDYYTYQTLMWWNSIIPRCPCNEFSALISGLWIPSFEESACYDSFPGYGVFGRRCCYRASGNFENRMPLAGSFHAASPFRSRILHESYDTLPKKWCCELSDLCHLYYFVRPAPACVNNWFFFAFSFGEPHIITLDGQSYTFNGQGEYKVLEIQGTTKDNMTHNFRLQGRTCRAANKNGTLTDATVWCALALNTTSGNTLRVEISSSGSVMIIYVNDIDYSARFTGSSNFSAMEEGMSIRKVNESLKVSTSDSVGITVSLANKLLDFTIDIEPKFQSMTRGLLGNFNGDSTDDLIFPNGTKLPNDTSERQIYEYGQTWAITQSESIFKYVDGQNTSTFSNLTFVPIFLSEVNATVRQEAEDICGSASDLPCIYDFIATRNADIAKGSRSAAANFQAQTDKTTNSAPVISGPKNINITVNVPITIVLNGSDADNDTIYYEFFKKPASGVATKNESGDLTVTYTASSLDGEHFEIVARDTKGLESEVYVPSLLVCSGCNGKGTCDFEDEQKIVSPYYTIVACDCNTGYSGDHCEQDKDGCANSPCPQSTNCTDIPAAEEISTGRAYNCSNCPAGFHLMNGTKCQDIDECTSHPCDPNANCTNTVGSYVCTCLPGFRKFDAQCRDVNECVENKHDCAQICINESPFYNCGCYEGFEPSGSVKNNCTKLSTDPCKGFNKSCAYGCRNNSGVGECFCPVGLRLTANGTSCEDVDECSENLCSQICENSIGSYKCSCFPGYVQSAMDNLVCEPCVGNKYGNGCSQTCNCRGRSITCDAVKGCICQPGWYGDSCQFDVDECDLNTDNCRPDQLCINNNGSFTCSCPNGYEESNGTCININECLTLSRSNCSQLCVDNPGSFTCLCRPGYIMDNGICKDIDECEDDISGCDQKCTNVGGSFNCECYPSFILNDDRKTCSQDLNPCATANVTCSHACYMDSSNTPQCLCPSGYILGTDNTTCFEIDECAVSGIHRHRCSDICINTPGSYNCSCPVGKKLQNDERSCEVCNDYHWGPECINECGCYPKGSSHCDPVSGCICKNGWGGPKCDQDVNECDYATSPCPQFSNCINTPGSFYCNCTTGYKMEKFNNTCVDEDECTSNNPCQQICTNAIGSYFCSCHKGFLPSGDKCIDINECTIPDLNKCDQSCRNTAGGFACDCRDGFQLNVTTRNTCDLINVTSVCNTSNSCQHVCTLQSGKEVCSCHPGFNLNTTDNKTCIDIDECAVPNRCVKGTCINKPGLFECSCDVGYKLGADKVTCQACDFGFHGTNCSQSCGCNTTNSVGCNATTGVCACNPGWNSADCSTDINECLNTTCPQFGTCVNSPGSFRCVCDEGYFSSDQKCKACDATKYGQDCQQNCSCVFANTQDCNDQTGQCVCQRGWNGSLCEVDIDECANASYCAGTNVKCFNLNGSAECRCNNGYEQLANNLTCQDINECLNPLLNVCPSTRECNNTDGSYSCVCKAGYQEINGSCIACNETYYGRNCAIPCTCITNNTADCNDVAGTCSCKTGWKGTNCEVDINECEVNTSFCPDLNSTCFNQNGSAQCRCKNGYGRLTADGLCQACNATHFGQECALTCNCSAANTLDCNDTTGACNCKPGWEGPSCDQDIGECSNNASYCSGLHEVCHNLNGSAECICADGFERNATTCQACNATHYGQNCANTCTCVSANTQDCNDTNGACICKGGWSGSKCDTDIDECLNSSSCPNANEICKNLNSSFECDCAVGFQRTTSNAQCQVCGPNQYGYNCTSQCLCESINTAACNAVNGKCTCKSGWTGTRCELDIDECQTNYCTAENQICHNQNGSAYCECDVDYKNVSNICIALFKRYTGEIHLNLTADPKVFDNTTREFMALRDKVIKSLKNFVTIEFKAITSLRNIMITHFTNGSIVAHTELHIDTNSTTAPADAESFFSALPNKTLSINGTDVKVLSVAYGNKNPIASTDNKDLIIGLAVGIPLFVILVIVITVCVCCYVKRRSSKHTRASTPSEDREAPFRSIFATQIATKGSWGTPSLYTPDAYSDAGTSHSSREGQLIKGKKRRSDFKGSAWYDQQAAAQPATQASTSTERPNPPPEGQTSNFSWEYMFTLLEPHKGFEIQRPNYSPSPNPAFVVSVCT
ncbi:unnamed protein product, partial [Lymnaea stagnalis]